MLIIKLGLTDRYNYNVMLRCLTNGDVELEKLFDFGSSCKQKPVYPEYYCYDVLKDIEIILNITIENIDILGYLEINK
ncbi:MAG: hypothetical protein ACI4XM_03240 [Candidatus Coprovivens sp.]